MTAHAEEKVSPDDARAITLDIGCSNDTETSLTIIHRSGEFWVAGFTFNWDTRDYGIGGCDINFLAGKGVFSRGPNGRKKPIKARFAPIRLADWSDEKRPKACD